MQTFYPCDWKVVGAGRRSLVLQYKDSNKRVFVSTKVYAKLMTVGGEYVLRVRAEHEDPRTGRFYPETTWMGMYEVKFF